MRERRSRWSNERGSVLVLAIFIMALLLAAGMIMLRMSASETDIAYNTVWAEGSFYAAEAAIAIGIDQLGPTLVADNVTSLTFAYFDENHNPLVAPLDGQGLGIPAFGVTTARAAVRTVAITITS